MPKVTDYIVALYGCPSNNELVIWLNLYNRTLPFLTSPHCTCNMLLNSEEGNSGDIHPWRDICPQYARTTSHEGYMSSSWWPRTHTVRVTGHEAKQWPG